jgi:maltooligosyltrehalose trehalohydrolase
MALANYSVWAPRAGRIDLQLHGRLHAMIPDDRPGWWLSGVAPNHGDRYGFVIDGAGPFPDPRSPSQPDGVHGLSAHVEHGHFGWTDARFQQPPLGSAVIYELHVGSFSSRGTFTSLVERLDHLVDLGVTHVELMPIAEFSGDRGWGYDGVDLFAPHHAYGGPDGLKELVDACHARGLGVLLDVVYNHLGPAGNYLNRFGPYFTDRHRTPWGDAVNLDGEGSDEVRRFLCDNAIMWLRDYHVDGLRLDAVHTLVDASACHFLEQLAIEVERLQSTVGRHLVLIAESDLNDPRVIRPKEIGGYALDAQWADDFHHAIHAALTGERSGYYADYGRLRDVATAFRTPFLLAGDYSEFRGRAHGRFPRGSAGHQFVVATQNHDQIGNRATGDRLVHLTDTARARVAAGLLFFAPYIPLIFQGEEWAASSPFLYFTAHEDPALAAAVSEGRRREFAAFGWPADAIPDPQAIETFERSRLRWEEVGRAPHREMLAWYRALIELRRTHGAVLRDGSFQDVDTAVDENRKTILIRRSDMVLAANLGEARATFDVPPTMRLLLASDEQVSFEWDRVVLPASTLAILQDVGEMGD